MRCMDPKSSKEGSLPRSNKHLASKGETSPFENYPSRLQGVNPDFTKTVRNSEPCGPRWPAVLTDDAVLRDPGKFRNFLFRLLAALSAKPIEASTSPNTTLPNKANRAAAAARDLSKPTSQEDRMDPVDPGLWPLHRKGYLCAKNLDTGQFVYFPLVPPKQKAASKTRKVLSRRATGGTGDAKNKRASGGDGKASCRGGVLRRTKEDSGKTVPERPSPKSIAGQVQLRQANAEKCVAPELAPIALTGGKHDANESPNVSGTETSQQENGDTETTALDSSEKCGPVNADETGLDLSEKCEPISAGGIGVGSSEKGKPENAGGIGVGSSEKCESVNAGGGDFNQGMSSRRLNFELMDSCEIEEIMNSPEGF